MQVGQLENLNSATFSRKKEYREQGEIQLNKTKAIIFSDEAIVCSHFFTFDHSIEKLLEFPSKRNSGLSKVRYAELYVSFAV